MSSTVVLAQINPCMGDLEANSAKIKELILAYTDNEVAAPALIVFPQMAITGYPPADLLTYPSFLQKVVEKLNSLSEFCHKTTVIIGTPFLEQGYLYNGAAVLQMGKPVRFIKAHRTRRHPWLDNSKYFTVDKEPYAPFNLDEFPYSIVFSIDKELLGATYYQDLQNLKSDKPLILINLSATPYVYGKHGAFLKELSNVAHFNKICVVDVNLVGGQDQLILEGGSVAFNAEGKLLAKVDRFVEGCVSVDFNGEGTELEADYSRPFAKEAEQFEAISLGLLDYMRKNGFTDVVLGISGGIDSALCAAIAVHALGAEHVHGVYMPSCYSSDISTEEGAKLCRNLGIDLQLLPIEGPRSAFNNLLAKPFANSHPDVTEENIQARIRAIILMALSNKFGWLNICTANKAESACGYSTLYGDATGGISPIADLYKHEVRNMCLYVNRDKEIIPNLIITRPPSAELRPGQKDSDSLPDYDILDAILYQYLEAHRLPEEIVASGYKVEDVRKAIRLTERSEYKRRQEPFALKVSSCLLGLDRVMPMTKRG
ncbi:NAD+ synthase [bacterium]|nr:NAD+ synthase [bacterium]